MLPRLELQCPTEEYDSSGDGVAGQKITVPPRLTRHSLAHEETDVVPISSTSQAPGAQFHIHHPCSGRAPRPRARKDRAGPLAEPAYDTAFFLRPRIVARISPPHKGYRSNGCTKTDAVPLYRLARQLNKTVRAFNATHQRAPCRSGLIA
jgi:hypothetical protein